MTPKKAKTAAQGAVTTTLKWIANRPPYGVSSIGNLKSTYFQYARFTDARVDVENLAGN